MYKNKKKLIIGIILAAIVILIAAFLFINIKNNAETYTSMITDSSFEYVSSRYKNGVVVCGGENVSFLGKNGKTEWTYNFLFTDPILSTNGKYILTAARGGEKVVL